MLGEGEQGARKRSEQVTVSGQISSRERTIEGGRRRKAPGREPWREGRGERPPTGWQRTEGVSLFSSSLSDLPAAARLLPLLVCLPSLAGWLEELEHGLGQTPPDVWMLTGESL